MQENTSAKNENKVNTRKSRAWICEGKPEIRGTIPVLLTCKVPPWSLEVPMDPSKTLVSLDTVDKAFTTIQKRVQEDIKRTTVNFVVPLREKYLEFRRFLGNVRAAFLNRDEPIAVIVVYFPESSTPTKHIPRVNQLKSEFPEVKLEWLELLGKFNRARALQEGAKHLGNDSLLFFADIDLVFRTEFVYRCRSNTIQGTQVYMPLMFGRYNPDVVYLNNRRPKTSFVYTNTDGCWRVHSYGHVCIYGSDVMAVGGLNTNIVGWGKEDKDFADRIMKGGLTIFRAPDQSLVHVCHEHVACDESIPDDQRKDYEAATLSTYVPKTEAIDYMVAKG